MKKLAVVPSLLKTERGNEEQVAASIVIPCRNEKKTIESCIRSIFAQEIPAGGFEIIVADGMSDDGTRQIIERLAAQDSRLRIVENPDRIVSAGLNAAIRASKGEVIVRMDAHTEYASDYVRQCLMVLNETSADNVGGPWIAKGTGIMGSAIAAAFQSPFAVGGARGHDGDYTGPVDTVYLGCWPRTVFERMGLFDEDFGCNEDDEFNLRLSRNGGNIQQSTRIRSWYVSRSSLGALFRQYMRYGYWKPKVMQKHKLPASIRHLVPALFVFSLLTMPVLSLWWPFVVWGELGMLAAYSTCNILASLLTARRYGLILFPVLPAVLFTYHFAYGLGFLLGIWNWLILRRKDVHRFEALRSSYVGDH